MERRTLNLHLTRNPELVQIIQDKGKCTDFRITHFYVDDDDEDEDEIPQQPKSYYQVKLGDMVETHGNAVFNMKPDCMYLRSSGIVGNGTEVTYPFRVHNDEIPNSFVVYMYAPGIDGKLITYGEHGAQIFIEYNFTPL